MRIERRDGSDEKRVLTGMIVDGRVLGMIAAKWQPPMFKVSWSNLVAGWCIDYYTRYQKAPKANIEGMFEAWASKATDKSTVDLIERFLDGLSREYEAKAKESNTEYTTDLAGRYFNRVRLRKLLETIEGQLDMGNAEEAQRSIENFTRVEIGLGSGVDAFQDEEALQTAFDNEAEVLIEYPGDLGKFFGPNFERDGLVSFMGPEKRGKTFWLIDVAFRAMLQRRRVGFFQVGDMSQNQMMRRLAARVARHPLRPEKIKYPLSIDRTEDGAIVEIDHRRFDSGLSWQKAWKACEEGLRKRLKSKASYFKLSTHANSSITVNGIESILQTWEREDWVADVVVIDYADILLMESGDDNRNKINECWKQLRRLSQTWHCLVITATQSDAASYTAGTMGRQHFSEDKRKLAHVTGMIGLNQTEDEKDESIMRLNWIARRESHYVERKCIYVVGCLPIANPAVKSTL